MSNASATSIFATGLEVCLVLAGCLLLWRRVFSPTACAHRTPPLLAPWQASSTEFMMFLWLVLVGGIALPVIVQFASRPLNLDLPARTILLNTCFHGGMLLGVGLHHRFFHRTPPTVEASPSAPVPWPQHRALLAGVATFLMVLPVMVVVGLISTGLMKLAGLPIESQESVALFRTIKSPLLLGLMAVIAVILAPVTEEFVFRAGVFRFTRTRLPRWAALLLPACIFGALHTHLPSFLSLVALGVIFSLAYERTGRISTAIVAHALFNGYSMVRIFIDPSSATP